MNDMEAEAQLTEEAKEEDEEKEVVEMVALILPHPYHPQKLQRLVLQQRIQNVLMVKMLSSNGPHLKIQTVMI